MTQPKYTLMENATTDTTGSTASAVESGEYILEVNISGTATVTLQMLSDDGSSWIDLTDANGQVSLTASEYKLVDLPGRRVQATTAGTSGASVDVSLTLQSRKLDE